VCVVLVDGGWCGFGSLGQKRDPTETVVQRGSRVFAARLREEGIAARTDFYGGGTHSWPYWRRELRRALPTLLNG